MGHFRHQRYLPLWLLELDTCVCVCARPTPMASYEASTQIPHFLPSMAFERNLPPLKSQATRNLTRGVAADGDYFKDRPIGAGNAPLNTGNHQQDLRLGAERRKGLEPAHWREGGTEEGSATVSTSSIPHQRHKRDGTHRSLRWCQGWWRSIAGARRPLPLHRTPPCGR